MQGTQRVQGRILSPQGDLGFGEITFGTHIDSVNFEPHPADKGASDNTGTLTWVPGFIDLHNHGGALGAFPSGSVEECRKAAEYHRSQGTTTMLASTVSANRDELCLQVERLAQLVDEGLIRGIHLEGPFVSPAKPGAQDPSRITGGDPDMFLAVIEAARGTVRAITFAPETDNVDELLALCKQHDIIASLGHTDTDHATTAEVIAKANNLGVTVTATHLFNAMPPLHHREPGPVGALLSAARRGKAYVELIADGVHLDDAVVDSVYGPGAFAVSDAMEAAGMCDGCYRLGHLDVTVTDRVARIANGAIAGGTSTIAEQFARFMNRRGAADAVRFTSTTAAEVLRDPSLGDIAAGKRADLVGLDAKFRPVAVYCSGQRVA
ncbi:amidohydrolase family protein [Corynebacterium aquatimens]|uniref:N-acetylglucosamine-6-phosphate deacetylase n=1 Tax=Corynebacterium TaxID=1716 RepID=UPI00351CCD86|nr:amidohydrolase family protein [Corynebacterium aquatimens]UIZ93367.1 amidohydrolase family protein [Corynebacterium sp. CNCTC7651]